jgi:hypothetical protein
MSDTNNPVGSGASDESLRRLIVDLIGPKDDRTLSDMEIESMLDGAGELDMSADQIGLIVRKTEAEIASSAVGGKSGPTRPAPAPSAPGVPIPSAPTVDDSPPSSPVLGFLGDVTQGALHFPGAWTGSLVLLIGALTLLVVFEVAVRGIHVHVDRQAATEGKEQEPGSTRQVVAAERSAESATQGRESTNVRRTSGEAREGASAPGLPAPAARLVAVDCEWVDRKLALATGALLPAGQKLELASGMVEIVFQCGADVKLQGPAIFEIQSTNSSYLTMGWLSARADTPRAHGFTVHSRTASTVDLGTEFTVMASADGHSQIRVVDGAVDVRFVSGLQSRRLGAGQSLEVEPGTPSVIARIEPGDGTPAFRFPTIEPPSNHDYADASQGHAHISVLRGKAKRDSGPVEVLLDGKGQSRADAPRESFFFHDNTSGMILLDLGRKIPVKKVNTYSWHQHHLIPGDHLRATQKYYLYGSPHDTPPGADGDLAAAGWTLIAQVDTDEFFGLPRLDVRPAQQAVSITASDGSSIGEYRYLLWDVRPTHWAHQADHSANTFYGEFDVYRMDERGAGSRK